MPKWSIEIGIIFFSAVNWDLPLPFYFIYFIYYTLLPYLNGTRCTCISYMVYYIHFLQFRFVGKESFFFSRSSLPLYFECQTGPHLCIYLICLLNVHCNSIVGMLICVRVINKQLRILDNFIAINCLNSTVSMH